MRHLAPTLALTLLAAPAAAQSPDYAFTFTYPAQAARIPSLRASLEADRTRARASIARQAAAGRAEAQRSGFPFRRYESTTTWKVVTDTPRLLSLSGAVYTFTGGAHGSPGSTALVWDKAAGRRLAPKTLFTSPAALEAATRDAWCARLAAERRRRVGVQTTGPFTDCPRLAELTLLLGSARGGRIDRIGLLADPYVAGSYAEGTYEVTLPVTPAILRAVKPAYRTAFAIGQ